MTRFYYLEPKGEYLRKRNVFDAEWHSLQIKMTSDKLRISLDTYEPVLMDIETAEKSSNPTDPVYFGGTGSLTFGVESSTNFVGCLQQIEYNKVK